MLEFQHVSKTFKNQEVLHDINMEIHDGEFVVLIGPSGCGKTTSLKMINRLIAPSKGQILLNGSDIRNEDDSSAKKYGICHPADRLVSAYEYRG